MPKYLLINNYEGGGGCDTPMGEWDPADIRAHIDFQIGLDEELSTSGELVDSQGVGQTLTRVISDGDAITSEAVPVDGKLAGYRLVDVDSEERAVAIAARCSAAPGHGGKPIQQPIELRQVMTAP
jgi:hypothetical protein